MGFLEPIFGDGGANAAQRAAIQQQEQAQAAYGEAKGLTDRATVSGLARMEQDLKNQERNLSRQEDLIKQIDPTIIEASQQALRLLRGEDASTLNPLKRQRDLARQKLVNQLREQLGPGAETSTAGIQALTRFDSETSNLMAGAQQQAIQGLGQTAGQFTSTRPDLFREIMGLREIGLTGSNLLNQQANTLLGARQGLINTAGANEVAESIRGQNNAAMGRTLVGAGVGALSGGLGGMIGSGLSSGGSWLSGMFSGGGKSGTPDIVSLGMQPAALDLGRMKA